MGEKLNRRHFIAAAAAAGAALHSSRKVFAAEKSSAKPALLGGTPVRQGAFSRWPIMDEREDKAMLEVLHSGQWFRGGAPKVTAFENSFAEMMGAKHCIATNGGTTALITSLGALGIGPGDEVIVTPYTFIASVTSIMFHFALPIFVDIDLETFQIDARKIESAVTERTRAIMPVHIGGNVCDMDAIMAVAEKRGLPIIEDACQAHLAEWRGKKAGTLGTTGCFSFQVTKNLCSGEGGAILTDEDSLAEKLYAFHNNCRGRSTTGYLFRYMPTRAANFRMTEFQGALLSAQMTRLEEQSNRRNENAKYLTELLREIPGLMPAKMYEGCTRNAWHLYMMRYRAEEFAGLPRAKFMAALNAEGVPCGGGYETLDWKAYLEEAFSTPAARRVFPERTFVEWGERCRLPEYEKLCQETVWLGQTTLLGTRQDMEQIAEAVRKIHAFAAELAKT